MNKRPPSVTSAEMREDAASMRRKITEDMRADLEKDKQKMTKVGKKKEKSKVRLHFPPNDLLEAMLWNMK